MIRKSTSIAAFAGLLALTLPVSAAMSPQEEAAFRQNCTGDYMRLCAMFDPDSPQVDQCFKTKMKDLTPACQATIASYTKTNPRRGR